MRKLTTEELEKAKAIEATTRYEALDMLAKILESSTVDSFKWSRCTRCITSDGCKIDITTKKNKSTGTIIIKSIDVFGINKEWDTYNL